MNCNKLKKCAAGILMILGIFAASFVIAGPGCCVKACPCPQHWYYSCSASCGGLLEDHWHEPCCSGSEWVADSSQGSSWEKCDASEPSAADPKGGKHYADSSCLTGGNTPQNASKACIPPSAQDTHGANCKALGAMCTANADCCSSSCIANICDDDNCGACKAAGLPCGANAECCSSRCTSGSCTNDQGVAAACNPIGKTCTANADCCSVICAQGKCTYSDGSISPAPSNKTLNNVTQPAILTWTQNGWYDTGQTHMAVESYGPTSFWFEMDNPDNQIIEPQAAPDSNYNPTTKVFSKCLTHNYFNTRTDGHMCFLNSAKTVTYRAKACANKNCTNCGPFSYWTMTTSQAPELLGFTDANNTSPVADPDWNGQQALSGSIDLTSATLRWCAARTPQADLPVNQNQTNALSYQVIVHSDEQQATNLDNSTVPAKFISYADWLKIDKLGYGAQETCDYLEKQADGTCKAEVINPTSGTTPRLYYSNALNPNTDRDLITKNVTYYFQARPCYNNSNANDDSCQSTSIQNYGEKWKLQTAQTPLAAPALSSPPDDQQSAVQLAAIPVGLPTTIAWKQPSGANSYEYQIQEYDGTTYKDLVDGVQRTVNSQVLFSKTSAEASSTDVEPVDLKLDTAYRWRVHSCWPSLPLHADDCNEKWSAWFGFRTTGRAPKTGSLQPAAGSTQVALPVILHWEKVPGALSYLLTVNDKPIVVSKLPDADPVAYQLSYPDVTQNHSYVWEVQTCADEQATNCGPASDTLSFVTATLGTPGSAQQPQNQATVQTQDLGLTNTFSWDAVPGAQYYHFVLTYADRSSLETNGACTTGEKVNTFVTQSSTSIDNSPQGVYCLGNYKWNVQACMDKDCKDNGPASADWTFTLVPGENAKKGSGFMVCGQPDDNPNTPYDEREPCQAKHFFLMLEKIINFVLFQLAFWLLPILGMVTAAIFYRSLGGPETWATVKLWWKAIGIGYALLFGAWIIVGILLSVFGFTGAWWKI